MAESHAPKPKRHNFFTLIVTGFLLMLMVVVLLPLFWMILTAFKVKGTAFQLSFLPETTLVYPENPEDYLATKTLGPNDWYIHLEQQDIDATTIQVEIEVASTGKRLPYPMSRFEGGLWASTVGPLPHENIVYRYILNGEVIEPSPEELPSRTFSPIGSGIIVPGEDEPRYMATVQSNVLRLTLEGEADSTYQVRTVSGQLLDLTPGHTKENGKIVYTAPANASVPEKFKIIRTRSFPDAVAAKYTLENFRGILQNEDFNFARYFLNSLIVAGGAGILTVFICTLAAYAFSTKNFHYREQIFALLLMSMLVPGMIYMVPQFSITVNLGLLNTYTGMIMPHLANVFGLFLLKQYIDQIPKDLFAAASIDGAREDQVFSNVVIPVCLPIMVTLFLLVFVGQWSNFLWQLIVNTGTSDVLTLPVGLQQFKGQNATEWEKIMAGACFSILPIAALFLSLQRYFMEGLTAGSVKE